MSLDELSDGNRLMNVLCVYEEATASKARSALKLKDTWEEAYYFLEGG